MKLKPYQLNADELGIFIDESGDTSLRDPTNSVFVFGASLIAGPDMDELYEPWCRLRKLVLGDSNSRLHMREHSNLIRDDNQAFLLEILGKSAFARIGISFTQSTSIDLTGPGSDMVLNAVLDGLLTMHADIARYSPSSRLALLFEKSPLHDRLATLCQHLQLERNGLPIPIRFEHLAKDEIDIGGEIADCIAHTVCLATRTESPEKFTAERYDAIFKPTCAVPARHLKLSGAFKDVSIISP